MSIALDIHREVTHNLGFTWELFEIFSGKNTTPIQCWISSS